jgi:FkbM family methyltransferase
MHPSEKIRLIVLKYENIDAIRQIWDIGSRDGQDSLALADAFPWATINSFEPNPDVFHLVKEVATQSNGKIAARNIALSNTDGNITFHKIDTSLTETTWKDGNPGASSIFLASGEYTIEKYVQIPIEVKSCRATTLIEKESYRVPNLIWIDVQGAEKIVLEGFQEYLSSVDFIFVELSLKNIYIGQSLANEVVKLLSGNFYWHSNLTMGTWQFDALFVNKRHRNFNLRIRNLLLFFSLKSKLQIGIKYSRPPLRTVLNRSTKHLRNKVFNVVKRNDSKSNS